METIQACSMVEVALCQRMPGVDEESQKQYAGGRTRRRRASCEMNEGTHPSAGSDRVEPMEEMAESEVELQQREKEPKKEDSTESQRYRYDDSDENVDDVDKALPICRAESVEQHHHHQEQVASRSCLGQLGGGEDIMQVEVADETLELQETVGGCTEEQPEGEPVPLDVVSEQLRYLSPSTNVTSSCGDGLPVIERAAAVINLHNERSSVHGSPVIPESPPSEAEALHQTAESERPLECSDGQEQHQPTHVSLLDTSRHSWHVDKETQINPTTDDLELSAIFTSNAPLQLRAVSSPSLSEAPIETVPNGAGNTDGRYPHLSGIANVGVVNVATINSVSNAHQNHAVHQKTVHTKAPANGSSQAVPHHPVQVSESVLQKFRKTFSHFKTSKAATPPTVVNLATSEVQNGATMSVEDKLHQQQHASQQQQQTSHHHRFGPLIWRSSKERRKTKSHRRDKCNSGDSGIQVELDNDPDQHLLLQHVHQPEHHPEGVSASRNGDGSHSQSYASVPVRRANSAKVSTSSSGSISSSILKHKLSLKSKDKENIGNISRLSGKSLSQPSGLDCIVKSPVTDCEVDGRRRRRKQHLRTATTVPSELDLSDSESISSNPDEEEEVMVDRGDRESERLLVEPLFAEVLFAFRPGGPQELGLEKGALVEVLKREAGPWWWGRVKSDAIVSTDKSDHKSSECGWFPKDFVKILPTYAKPKQIIIINDEASKHHQHGDTVNEDDDGGSSASTLIEVGSGCESRLVGACEASTGGGSNGQEEGCTASHDLTKENIIKELLETEINYVKLLNSLCMGFIKPLREREDVFSVESINIMFSNLEKIWRFQQTFLDALRLAVPSNRIGEVFLEYQSAFMVYSSYCNSYPRALMELENYTNNKEANQILENCRMAENLPELPLSAHLLAPIQRICRYPLHLSELVKHSFTRKELLPTLNLRKCTKSELETMDCREVFEMALSAMRRVTEMVNEGKRHSEYLSRVQARFENFQGPSINVHSTRLFLQTDAIRMSPNLWNNTYTLFLFDRQLIYCKKDLLKRTNYIYKGRIFLDNCRILNLPDGKMFGVTLKNALRLYCDTRNKWFDFCFRSSSSKLRFLNTLSSERQFCGESLFVSELDGGGPGSCFDDDNLSDREYFPYVDDSKELEGSEHTNVYDLLDSSSGFRPSLASSNSSSVSAGGGILYEKESHNRPTPPMMPPVGPLSGGVAVGSGGGNTLPKKSRKMPKEALVQQRQQQQQVLAATDYGSNSLGRRKLGNWFRKAKSTNSTPSQSPTHHPMAMSLAAISSNNNNNHSDSSSQSSLTGFQQRTLLSTLGSGAALLGGSGTVTGGSKDEDNDVLLF